MFRLPYGIVWPFTPLNPAFGGFLIHGFVFQGIHRHQGPGSHTVAHLWALCPPTAPGRLRPLHVRRVVEHPAPQTLSQAPCLAPAATATTLPAQSLRLLPLLCSTLVVRSPLAITWYLKPSSTFYGFQVPLMALSSVRPRNRPSKYYVSGGNCLCSG